MSFSKTVGVYTQVSESEKIVGGGSLRSYSPTDIIGMITGSSSGYYAVGGTDVAVADGGTNISSYSIGDILYASSSTVLSKLAAGTSGYVLTMGASIPAWVSGSSAATDATVSFTDITTNNSSTGKHGFLPKLTGVSSMYFNGTGGWSTPSGGQSLTISNLGSTTALASNYLYTGTITGRSITLPTGASNQDQIIYRGIAASSATITWPLNSVLQVGSSGYASSTAFVSGANVEFALSYASPYWFLADSSSATGAYYSVGGPIVSVPDGGTNISSYTTGDILYASAGATLSKLGIGGSNQYLGVIGGVPSWRSGDLGNMTGVVPTNRGGTNLTSYATGDILYASNSTTLVSLAKGVSGQVLTMGASYPSWATQSGSSSYANSATYLLNAIWG